jgi:hypothetical protein
LQPKRLSLIDGRPPMRRLQRGSAAMINRTFVLVWLVILLGSALFWVVMVLLIRHMIVGH